MVGKDVLTVLGNAFSHVHDSQRHKSLMVFNIRKEQEACHSNLCGV
jgi:hypothetical protein